jgi:hypothetical protein
MSFSFRVELQPGGESGRGLRSSFSVSFLIALEVSAKFAACACSIFKKALKAKRLDVRV